MLSSELHLLYVLGTISSMLGLTENSVVAPCALIGADQLRGVIRPRASSAASACWTAAALYRNWLKVFRSFIVES
jgi:hypothetical protein